MHYKVPKKGDGIEMRDHLVESEQGDICTILIRHIITQVSTASSTLVWLKRQAPFSPPAVCIGDSFFSSPQLRSGGEGPRVRAGWWCSSGMEREAREAMRKEEKAGRCLDLLRDSLLQD